jgi:hypothetical protein
MLVGLSLAFVLDLEALSVLIQEDVREGVWQVKDVEGKSVLLAQAVEQDVDVVISVAEAA